MSPTSVSLSIRWMLTHPSHRAMRSHTPELWLFWGPCRLLSGVGGTVGMTIVQEAAQGRVRAGL